MNLVREAVQFLIQRTVLFARQAAAVLRSHVSRFLPDHVQMVMKITADWRGIVTPINVYIDTMRQVVHTPTDLLESMHGHFVRIGLHWRRRRYANHFDGPRGLNDTRCHR
jgi:hypothetical protein